jgi:membrane-bound lytic murein transglycosylase B
MWFCQPGRRIEQQTTCSSFGRVSSLALAFRFAALPWLTSASLVALASLSLATPASAEIVYFTGGRSMNVKAHRVEGDTLVLSLRGGGEIECAASAIVSIEPDEVPWPEEKPAATEVRLKPDATGDLQDSLADASAYEPIIRRVAAEQGVDFRLVHAVIQVESAYQARARSPKGAIGLMQVMPATARQYGVTNPYDPVANIEAGTRHLKSLLQRFPLAVALAAYNAGEAPVERFGGIPPYPETRNYVSSILRLMK